MTRTISRKVSISLLSLCALTAASPLLAQRNGMIHQAGRTIVDGDNRPLQLRGVMVQGWLQWAGAVWGETGLKSLASDSKIRQRMMALVGPAEAGRFDEEIYNNFVAEGDIRAIAQLGFNSVRIPINHRLLEGNGPGWASVDRVLGWCERYHVYAILDLHAIPGGQARVPTADPDPHTLVWNSPEDQQHTVEVWRRIASRYRGRAIVAGFDLINEPGPTTPELVELYQRIIQAVRQVDPDHLIILEGGKLATDLSVFSKPPAENIAYSFHMYTLLSDNRAKLLRNYTEISRAQDVPLWVGEIGENNYEMIASTRQMLEDPANGVSGWSFWPWKMVQGKYPGLQMIQEPQSWAKVMDWLTALIPPPRMKPSREEALAGMREFVEAVKIQNCTLDNRMAETLIPR